MGIAIKRKGKPMDGLYCAYCLTSNENSAFPLVLIDADGEKIKPMNEFGAYNVVKAHVRGDRLEAYDLGPLPIEACTFVNGTALCTTHVTFAVKANFDRITTAAEHNRIYRSGGYPR